MKKPQWLIDCWALAPNIAREAELWIADRDRWKGLFAGAFLLIEQALDTIDHEAYPQLYADLNNYVKAIREKEAGDDE